MDPLKTGLQARLAIAPDSSTRAAPSVCFKIENALGEFRGFKEKMAARKEPVVRKSVMQYPDGPGLGLEINQDWLRQHTAKGETWWG
jgi:L-alanine-DL-glutamate epimerase-like enolase superfamily enzyme